LFFYTTGKEVVMAGNIIVIPGLAKPVIDRTDFDDGRVVFFLAFEAKPIWVSRVMPGCMYDVDDFEGWVALEHPPQKFESGVRRRGIFFPLRRYAIECAEEMVSLLARQLFRGSH